MNKRKKSSTSLKKSAVIRKMAQAINKGKRFLLTGHKNPDGDTIGSELAMESLLRRMGKSVDIYNHEPLPEYLSFLPKSNRVKASKRVEGYWDIVIVFECSGPDRMGNIIDLKRQAGLVINVDHHETNHPFGDINLIDPTAASNSEQLCELYHVLKQKPTPEEATSLFTGILTDTGGFQHANTKARTFEIASFLVTCGVDVTRVSRKIFRTKSYTSLKLLGLALDSMQLFEDEKVSFMNITRDMFKQIGSHGEDTEMLISHAMMVPTVLVGACFRETSNPQVTKVSFRSRTPVAINGIAESFGGGGHKLAAGCCVPAPLSEARRIVLDKIRQVLPKKLVSTF